jgi:hypothetical protein
MTVFFRQWYGTSETWDEERKGRVWLFWDPHILCYDKVCHKYVHVKICGCWGGGRSDNRRQIVFTVHSNNNTGLIFWYIVYICVLLAYVHSVQQKSSGLVFHTTRSRSDVTYSCHHNSSRFTLLIFVHSCRPSVFHSLQSITPLTY